MKKSRESFLDRLTLVQPTSRLSKSNRKRPREDIRFIIPIAASIKILRVRIRIVRNLHMSRWWIKHLPLFFDEFSPENSPPLLIGSSFRRYVHRLHLIVVSTTQLDGIHAWAAPVSHIHGNNKALALISRNGRVN